MENSESSSRKRSPSDIDSSAYPGDRSSPSKRARVEFRAMGSILENRPVSTQEVMAGSTEHDHEEPELDLTLRLGMPGTTRNQRVQFQAPAVEDKIAKLEAVRAELAGAEEENRLLNEKLSAATTENTALRDRLSKLLIECKATEKGEDEQVGALVLYSPRPNQTPSDQDRPSSSSNPDQAEPSTRKPQVFVRIRTEQPMTEDGCHWKKYGQKTLGSAFPRAYYRCSLQKGCSVTKKVQRCAEDPTVLITKYEGSHDHLLPPAAVATANGTSEAMSMLLSGSLCSTNSASTSSNSFLAGATISAVDPFPAVMVDYTRPPPPVDRTRELTRAIFRDPEFNAALVAAIAASSGVLTSDGNGQEDGKKDPSK